VAQPNKRLAAKAPAAAAAAAAKLSAEHAASAVAAAERLLELAANRAREVVQGASSDARSVLGEATTAARTLLDSVNGPEQKIAEAVQNHGQLEMARRVLAVAASTAQELVTRAATEANMLVKTAASEPHLKQSWHVGKEIPIAAIAAVAFYTFTGVYWVLGLSNKLDNTASDVLKQAGITNQLIDKVATQHDAMETLIQRQQNTINTLNILSDADRTAASRIRELELNTAKHK
jgi:cell division septum initiation protein DivIVA